MRRAAELPMIDRPRGNLTMAALVNYRARGPSICRARPPPPPQPIMPSLARSFIRGSIFYGAGQRVGRRDYFGDEGGARAREKFDEPARYSGRDEARARAAG